MTKTDPKCLSNNELLDATVRAAGDERSVTAELIALLGEVDIRRLYLGEGSSLFTYCTQVLRLSEHAAYHRIEAARAAQQYPVLLELVATGDLTLTTVVLLRPHLTTENHEALLEAARHRSKREVEYQMACLAPKVATRALLRRLPDPDTRPVTPRDTGQLTIFCGEARVRPTVAPLASDRYLLRVTLSADGHSKLRRAQDLMRYMIPDGDPAAVVDRALTLLVEQLEKTRTAQTAMPRRASFGRSERSGGPRYISAPVKRAVWARDEGRCAFVGAKGRCTETGRLEYHHMIPFARGGSASVANIALRCRAHNGLESELVFGRWSRPAGTRLGPDRVERRRSKLLCDPARLPLLVKHPGDDSEGDEFLEGGV